MLGPLTLWRAYYHCPPCDAGCFPRDAALGLDGGSLSPTVLRMTGSAAALVSFAETSALLAELAGLRVDTKQVECCAEALGREIAAAERDSAFPSEDPPAPTMYLVLDGTGLPERKSEATAIDSPASGDTDPEPSAFVRREAERRGFPRVERGVVLGDGTAWIWRIAAENYPGAVQIVELFHAK